MKKYINIFIAVCAIVVVASATVSSEFFHTHFRTPNAGDNATPALKENFYAPELPMKLAFCGENVPLSDFEVRERYDRELVVNCYRHSNTILLIKRSSKWLPVIEPILKEYGVPDDMKYLCMAESEFLQDVSPAGASGFWQIMRSTANMYGLTTNDEVDERYNVEKATRAACKYLNDAYNTLGSWTLAAASYNMGIAGVKNSISKQGENNYYDLLLNSETSRYVFRILAMKTIFENQKSYGFYVHDDDKYIPLDYSTETVSGSVSSWVTYAQEHNVTYRALRIYNPWIRDVSLKNLERKTYTVKIPKE